MVCLETLRQRLAEVRTKIARTCERCGRKPNSVKLIGVTKTLSAEDILPAIEYGLEDLGENYIQELRSKVNSLPAVNWHFIGHLQRNKARYAVESASVIHSLDSLAIIRAIDRHCCERGLERSGLLQIRLGGENTKSGLNPEELWPLLEELKSEPPRCLRLVGLMTVPPPACCPEDNRQYFRYLNKLLENVKSRYSSFWQGSELSMGMSGDYLVAIEEGATMVRVGRAIFGERSPKIRRDS